MQPTRLTVLANLTDPALGAYDPDTLATAASVGGILGNPGLTAKEMLEQLDALHTFWLDNPNY